MLSVAAACALRQGLLKLVGWSFAPVGNMLQNTARFDAAGVQKSALRIAQLAAILPDTFQTDTRTFQVKTRARENIWSNKAAGTLRPASELRMHERLREVYRWLLPRPNLAVFLPDW
jgi:cytochrome c556